MKLMPYSLGVLSLALLALLAPPSAAVPGADPTTAAAPGAATRQHTASQIGTFLTTFYGDHGPSAFDRRYRISSVLQERQVLSPDGDVLLCAQNQPKDIGIGPVTVAQLAGVGWATVTTHWEAGVTDTFTAYVRLDSRPIRLDDVICAG
ncbi:hypothetical protein [Streptomyces xanthophaeus]|uniref:Secreted protein n=1 Tax=Streptomyces xanthophaeus TaxID=67385 RepID=A0A919GV35_9ACTN|nr:hypothetical protein [Streptomyces xanthophaeus]WST20929.1 hypothetical protein OG264_05100 [Streptomyces xanthophaeus]WST64084.1 hypothetical protein OG605_33260 [Streptomyces xanthophaeus]GHI83677.1 hypothetical protein Sxan_10410 [Streptomyces xanthophaeus]